MTNKATRIIAIIQARIGSTRLPSKVLEDIAGKPMLTRVVNRTSKAKNVHSIMIATTTNPIDDAIAYLCKQQGWAYFRGSEEDVLDRYYQASLTVKATAIVRITADCPLIEPEIIDRVIDKFLSCHPEPDYVSNTLHRTFPRGLDVEVISTNAMAKAWEESKDLASREHVTPYIWRQPDKFVISNIKNDVDLSHMRWTVDTAEDLIFIRKVYDNLAADDFTWRQVLKLLSSHPEWLEINRHIKQKTTP